jgi:two-component system phosphate regulon sensor histidine kinase PhoR
VNIVLPVLLLVLLVLAIVQAVFMLRLFRERTRSAALLNPAAGESLEDAIRRLTEEAELARHIPELEGRFDQLIANCPLPVLFLDENLTIVNLSMKAEAELDQPRKRRSLLEGLESNELEMAARRAIETLKPAHLTVRLYAAGRRPYFASLVPFQSGPHRMCLVFLQDVAATVEFGELRSQFAATVSHELRTPLAGIRALAETLQNPDIEAEEMRRFLSQIDRETNRLSQLIDEILFLSSLESGATSLEGSTELLPLSESLIEKLQPLAARFEVTIKSSIPAGLSLPLPERMASTVLSNLLENAIKYAGRGSRVELIAARDGDKVRVQVRDDGIGIDAEHLPHIFERFYRVDKSRSRRLGGTGLGLSIVKHVVESAGGEARASSREGFGTEMTILLPSQN